MATTVPFSFRCKAGDNTTPSAAVPAGTTGYRLEVNVSAWTPSQTVSATVQLSQDGFATIVLGAAITTQGGTYTDRFGNPALPGVEANLPPGSGWTARGLVNVPSPGTLTGNLITSP